MKSNRLLIFLACACACLSARAIELSVADSPGAGNLSLSDGKTVAAIFVETNDDRAVLRAAGDLADDLARVTGTKPEIENQFSPDGKIGVIIGTLGNSKIIDRLARNDLRHLPVVGNDRRFTLVLVGGRAGGAEKNPRAAR